LFGIDSVPRLDSPSQSSIALDNLRGIVILIVLAFHSALAYLQWNPTAPAAFDSPPFAWRAFPIEDSHRFFGFDLFCAWQDVYLMSLMFFLSGLFVWPSLVRKRDWGFLRNRLVRLGLPYVFGIAILMPLAVEPAYLATALDKSAEGYWRALLELPFWPNGPLWFLWQLLVLNVIAAILHWAAPGAIKALGRWSAVIGTRPGTYFVALVATAAVAYIPLALAFTPWTWSDSGLFAVQLCRPLNYVVYFFAGVGVGVQGIDRGLRAADGALARRWAVWLAAAVGSLFLWMGLTNLTLNGPAPVGISVAADFSYVLACAAGCFFLIAVCLRFATTHFRILDALAANAYGLYLVHYVFVVWLQYALLDVALFAVVKFAIVFGSTLFLSCITLAAARRVPFGAQLMGSTRRRPAGFAP
jgi:surface polysaccharide O-acyltransferase-like enzyme